MTRLIWFDMETTGLTFEDAILEVGAIMTDEHFILFDTFHRIVNLGMATYPSGGTVKAGLDLTGQPGGIAPIVVEMHEKSGLWNEMRQELTYTTAQGAMEDFFAWVYGLADGDEKFCMAGAGVSHYDYPYLRHHWPYAMDKLFVYHQRDVSVLRRFVLENCSPDAIEFLKKIEQGETPHRVMPDLELAIQQAKAFRSLINAGARMNLPEPPLLRVVDL